MININKSDIKLWVTRPNQDAPKQQKMLQDAGYKTLCFGLLDIEIHDKSLNTDGIQAVIFTSANGVRAFVQNNGDINLPTYTVGDATKIQAEEFGFKNVLSASGDVDNLADLIKENVNPNDGALYHPSGSVVAKDLAALLNSSGYEVIREHMYSAVPVVHMASTVQEQIKNGEITGVLLMSPRTASTFVHLVRTEKLDKHIQNMVIFSLSEAVASICSGLGADLVVAKTPTSDSLLQKINAYFEN